MGTLNRIGRVAARLIVVAALGASFLPHHAAAATYTLGRTVIGAGGSLFATGGSYVLGSTSGQPAAGPSVTGSTTLDIGYWHAAEPVLDVDASLTATRYDALTDGLIVIRYLFGLTGTSMTSAAIGPTATRTDPAAIKLYLDAIRPALDADGNGNSDALTDGLIIIRYLFGLRGTSLINGAVSPTATRVTAADIEAYVQSLMP